MAGLADRDAAAQEALEEAGVKGEISRQPIGQFNYLKLFDNGKTRSVSVAVYPLEVTQEFALWREMGQRERRWLTPSDAIAASGEPELVKLLEDFIASKEGLCPGVMERGTPLAGVQPDPKSSVMDSISAKISKWFKA